MDAIEILKSIIPNPFRDILGLWRFNLCQKYAASHCPPYLSDQNKIILDITYHCNLECTKCNRSCHYAPTQDRMSLAQIHAFVGESISLQKKWKHIWLEGGEPTLHPELFQILECLFRYRQEYSPRTRIQINTNGYGPEVHRILRQLPPQLRIFNSAKTSPDNPHFCAFNLAPIDRLDQPADFSTGCFFPSWYGFALNMNGYYHCVCSAGIDRVLGLDIGRKKMPDKNDTMKDQKDKLCRYCGHFLENNAQRLKLKPSVGYETISEVWKEIYHRYPQSPPRLSKYGTNYLDGDLK